VFLHKVSSFLPSCRTANADARSRIQRSSSQNLAYSTQAYASHPPSHRNSYGVSRVSPSAGVTFVLPDQAVETLSASRRTSKNLHESPNVRPTVIGASVPEQVTRTLGNGVSPWSAPRQIPTPPAGGTPERRHETIQLPPGHSPRTSQLIDQPQAISDQAGRHDSRALGPPPARSAFANVGDSRRESLNGYGVPSQGHAGRTPPPQAEWTSAPVNDYSPSFRTRDVQDRRLSGSHSRPHTASIEPESVFQPEHPASRVDATPPIQLPEQVGVQSLNFICDHSQVVPLLVFSSDGII
jgi:hypothetical protein